MYFLSLSTQKNESKIYNTNELNFNKAEGILRRVSREQSRGVRQLAEAIRSSFQKIRTLLIKYGENIEVVDPQLRNNAELVEVLGKP